MTTFRPPRSFPALALFAVLASGTGLLMQQQEQRERPGAQPPERAGARALGHSFREVAREISPSVVGVLAIHEAPVGMFHRLDRFQTPDDFLRRFFGEDGPGGADRQNQREDPDGSRLPAPMPTPQPRGQGTGVIVDADGIIATNNHMVVGAKSLEVTLHDGRKLPAEVVGTDPETDLALLRVKEKNLPAAKLGDSTKLEPGDWVVAVGNPFGLDHTVTVGVVSAVRRSGMGVASYENFIQTDAAINPGNSGGPLVNLDGEVVGINTAIRTTNGGSDGISFAIPSATLSKVMPDLIDGGRVRRGWLGITLQTLTPELARSFGVEPARGALISEVLPETPAAESGLRPGDVVLSIQGREVRDDRELRELVAGFDPGTEVALGVARDGETNELRVELGERPPQEDLARRPQRGPRPTPHSRDFGLGLGDVPPPMAEELQIEGGALVREVAPDSPAASAGLRPGEVILSVGDRNVRSAEDAAQQLAGSRSGARLLVRSQEGSARWVFLERRKDTP